MRGILEDALGKRVLKRSNGVCACGVSMEDPRFVARMMAEKDPRWLDDLWVSYWANGGSADKTEFYAYINGLADRNPFELKILAWAIEDLEDNSL